jgi:hypothetical protein
MVGFLLARFISALMTTRCSPCPLGKEMEALYKIQMPA